MRSFPKKFARAAIPLSVLLTCQKLLANSGIQLPLTQFQAGTEKANLVPNGDFEQHGAFDSNGLTTQANNWSQFFGMEASNQPFNTPAQNPSAIGTTVAQSIVNANSPNAFQQSVDLSSLPKAHDYVLSAYIWNRGRPADPSNPKASDDLAVVKIFENSLNLDNNLSLDLATAGSDGGSAATGYFIYDTISATELATWNQDNILFSVEGDDGTFTTGTRPNTWAQFDNVGFTPAENFVGQKWISSSGGDWKTATSWNSQAEPNVKGAIVTFSDGISSDQIITLSKAETCAIVNLDNPTHSWTIAGLGQLTLDTSVHGSNNNLPGGLVEINDVSGSHTISAPIAMARDGVFNVINANSTLTISGSVTTKTVALTASTSYSGQNLTKDGAGMLRMKSFLIPNITLLAGNTQMIPNGGAANASRIKSLTISGGMDGWMSQLDLTNDDMAIDYTGGSSPLATIQNQLKNGYANGAWNGQGIISSNAKASSTLRTMIGFVDTATYNPGTFDGVATNGNMILMKYALAGDANLDGVVNALDFNALANNYGTAGTGTWVNGDFNYDGTVNSADFAWLATNYGQTFSASDAMPLGAVVPEPTTIGLVISGLLLAHRRRK